MKIIMMVGNHEYTSISDWESIEDFHAAANAGNLDPYEFGDASEIDVDTGHSCRYREE